MIYEFSVIASGLDPQADDFEDRFYGAGCDDATVAFQKGLIILDFGREAPSLDVAITSAIADVRRAGAHVDRIEPDPLVTLADIADRSGLTRAAVTLFAKGERGTDFPSPVACVTTRSPLWEWPSVAAWLVQRGNLGGEAWAQAVAVSNANSALVLDPADQERETA